MEDQEIALIRSKRVYCTQAYIVVALAQTLPNPHQLSDFRLNSAGASTPDIGIKVAAIPPTVPGNKCVPVYYCESIQEAQDFVQIGEVREETH